MRHIVWDWNGCLLDDIHVVVDAVNAALGAGGLDPITATDYRRHYTRPVRVFYERLFGRPVEDGEWCRLDDAYHDAYASGLERADLASDTRAALDAAADAGATQSLLSMWRHDELVRLVRHFDLTSEFLRVDGRRGRGGERKAGALQRHLAALPRDVAPHDVTVVGDALDDAAAARHVGADCILYEGGSHRRSDLEAAGVPVVTSLLEAVRLVQRVA